MIGSPVSVKCAPRRSSPADVAAWQRRAAELGNVVGAHALMVEGDYEGYPTMAEAEAFIAGRARVSR